MDTGKTLYQHSTYTQVPWFHRSVFTGRTLAVILITYNNSSNTGSFIRPLCVGYGAIFTSELILHRVGLFIEEINSTDQHIVTDIIKVTAEF